MHAAAAGDVISTKGLWAGRMLSGLVVLFLLMDGVMKLIKPAPVLTAQAELGWPDCAADLHGSVCGSEDGDPGRDSTDRISRRCGCDSMARGAPSVFCDSVSGVYGDCVVGGTVSTGRAVV
jgi:hypothetical protein